MEYFVSPELMVKLEEKGFQVNDATIRDILQWLSKEFNVSIFTQPRYFMNTLLGWECDIHIFGDDTKSKYNVVGRHDKEKDALIKCIEYVLENII